MTPQAPPAGVRTRAPAEDKLMNKQKRTRTMFQVRFQGCGLCVAECPSGAIEMEPEPS